MKFNIWLENRKVEDAVVGAISPNADPNEREDILSKKTTFFGSEVRTKIKNLGVVKATNDDRGRYGEIVKAIDDGVTVGELIRMIS